MGGKRRIPEGVRASILEQKDEDRTVTSVAEEFSVSRRTVDFIWYPEKAQKNNEQGKARARDGRYYNRERNTINVRNCRERKKARELGEQESN